MTKQERIQEAYGEHFEKCNPDENGWSKYQLDENQKLISGFNINSILDCEFNNFRQDNANFIYCIRPKSLQGIENNNGWISVKDKLPTFTIEYWVVRSGSLAKAYYRGNDLWINPYNDFPKTSKTSEITHYQCIIEPNPPLY